MSLSSPAGLSVEERCAELRQQLVEHPLYAAITSPERLRVFLREHVFAVWDFMSLLKRLQQDVCCVTVPWLPPRHAAMARFVNEIVLAEESDEDGRGGFASHFELYVQAMSELQADTQPVEQFLARLRKGSDAVLVLDQAAVLPSTRNFVRTTLHLVRLGLPHEIAAAFFWGREDIIPEMFARLVTTLEQRKMPCERLGYYLKRHIDLDQNSHGPLAEKLVEFLCDGSESKRNAAWLAAEKSLTARLRMWDGIYSAVQELPG